MDDDERIRSTRFAPAIAPAAAGALSAQAVEALGAMTFDEGLLFQRDYDRRHRSTTAMVALAVFLPVQLFLLGRAGLGAVFLLTCGGLGAWWIAEWFLTPRRVCAYNAHVAEDALLRIGLLPS